MRSSPGPRTDLTSLKDHKHHEAHHHPDQRRRHLMVFPIVTASCGGVADGHTRDGEPVADVTVDAAFVGDGFSAEVVEVYFFIEDIR